MRLHASCYPLARLHVLLQHLTYNTWTDPQEHRCHEMMSASEASSAIVV
jgi:hypothetical protein